MIPCAAGSLKKTKDPGLNTVLICSQVRQQGLPIEVHVRYGSQGLPHTTASPPPGACDTFLCFSCGTGTTGAGATTRGEAAGETPRGEAPRTRLGGVWRFGGPAELRFSGRGGSGSFATSGSGLGKGANEARGSGWSRWKKVDRRSKCMFMFRSSGNLAGLARSQQLKVFLFWGLFLGRHPEA